MVQEVYTVPGFHKTQKGRNGSGGPWHTDGEGPGRGETE